MGSSPHTRGAPGFVVKLTIAGRIIPAYAGSTRRRISWTGFQGDHPRIRGEHHRNDPFSRSDVGSSPHTRGALVVFSLDPHFRRIIPAYAGSTIPEQHSEISCQDHPRIRGEHAGMP